MHFKTVATGDLAEIVRKLLDEAKCSTLDYVIQSLRHGWYENINNTERMQKPTSP